MTNALNIAITPGQGAAALRQLRDALEAVFPDRPSVGRSRFLMTAPLAKLVMTRRKKTTIRYTPDQLEYPTSETLPLFVVTENASSVEPKCHGLVRVHRVNYKQFGALSDDDARNDGYKSKKELINALTGFYGKIEPSEIVCIYDVEFASAASS